jgi:hypothetical protein
LNKDGTFCKQFLDINLIFKKQSVK